MRRKNKNTHKSKNNNNKKENNDNAKTKKHNNKQIIIFAHKNRNLCEEKTSRPTTKHIV